MLQTLLLLGFQELVPHMARTLIYCNLYIISGHKYTPMPDYDWSLILVNDLKKNKIIDAQYNCLLHPGNPIYSMDVRKSFVLFYPITIRLFY